MKKIKRYIPTLVYNLIQKLDFKNKEHLYIICDMITRSSIYRKEDIDYCNTFTDIPKYYFRDLIADSKSLKNSFDILKDNDIILCDNVYSKDNGKALGYKFNDSLISKLIPIELDSKVLSKKIINNKNTRNNLVNDSLKMYKEYYLNTFSIDYDNAIEYLNQWYEETHSNYILSTNPLTPSYVGGISKIINKYNSIFISLSSINDGDLFFNKNKTNGRIDTNLTNLKGEYKQFISTKEIYQIDIVNSQPFILSTYINTLLCGRNLDKNDIKNFIYTTKKGIFYENFEREYFNNTGMTISRKEIKNMMFCIFYSKNESYKKEKTIFKKLYPTVMNIIEEEKIRKHNQLAINMQKLESEICIDIICKELDLNNIKYYTIHDAWLVNKNDIKKTEEIILRSFNDKYKTQPTLDIKKIN